MNLWFNIPFATMLLASAMSAIPDSIIEAAQDAGASRVKLFFSMILPLTYKDVFIAITFIFMSNIGSFTTPYLIKPFEFGADDYLPKPYNPQELLARIRATLRKHNNSTTKPAEEPSVFKFKFCNN